MRQGEKLTSHLDWPLLITYLVLLCMGIATVYSVAFDEAHPGLFSFSEKYGKQVVWLCVAMFLGFLVFLIDATIYKKFSLFIYLATLVLLVVVLFMPAVNGAHAWLGFGNLGIQPAEFAKIGTAVLLARFISDINVKQQTVSTVIMANLIILIPMGLILLQPDAGTFVVFTAFLFVMYREGITYDPIVLKLVNLLPGVRFKQTWVGSHFIPILFVAVIISIITLVFSRVEFDISLFPNIKIPGVVGVISVLFLFSLLTYLFLRFITGRRNRKNTLIIAILGFVLSSSISLGVYFGFNSLASHQKARIELFLGLNEDDQRDAADYNRNRAMAAVGSGGLKGKGYREASLSSVEANHVPESETDFIFCPYAEEWGFIGTSILIVLYLFLLLRVVVIAERQKSAFNRVYAYSVAMILFYHFAINIGMNIGFAPVIGIPLPFFSYGGSSTMSFSIFMFILLKLDSQRNQALF